MHIKCRLCTDVRRCIMIYSAFSDFMFNQQMQVGRILLWRSVKSKVGPQKMTTLWPVKNQNLTTSCPSTSTRHLTTSCPSNAN